VQARSDAGTTVVEVMITSALFLLVMTMMFGILNSMQSTTRRVDAVVSNEQDARFVVTQLLREVRAANPLEDFSDVPAAYQTQIELQLGALTGTQQHVRWRYDTASRTLVRELLDGTGAVIPGTSRVKLRNLRNAERGVVMFSYTGENGVDLVAAGNGRNVGLCAIHVEVVVTADSNPGPEPFTVRSDTEIRNRLPGGVGCG
jgi:hypothetical protein